MVKLTREELKGLVKEAIGDVAGQYKLPMEQTPEDVQAAQEAYRAKYEARKASKERWRQELIQVLGKIQGEIESSPEWNDGTRNTQEERNALRKGLGLAYKAFR